MNVRKAIDFCLSFPQVVEVDSRYPNNILKYVVHEKQFAYFKTSEPEKWRFSVRVSPDRFLELTDQPGVKPARYMHRFHWVTIVDVGDFYEDYLKELIHWSYQKAVSSLSKKIQAEILS
ncbi:MAG: hypothetical protein BMS9Abin25_0200 [Gammaproteobacteria bacterium]|nr:MAG: hypothetical protein BMS9Abin25_0200 [Gammaproteobacteria bacterium]